MARRDDENPNPHFPPPNNEERKKLELMPVGGRASLAPQTFGQAMEWARVLCDSELVPKAYRGHPADVLVCILWGANLGLDAVQALQNVMIANGKASVYGDAVLGIVLAKCQPGELEKFSETWDPDLAGGTWTTTVQRRGRDPIVRAFSMDEARRIKTTELDWTGVPSGGKPNRRQTTLAEKETYQNYPRRMCKFKARNEALRDGFPDLLLGITTKEDNEEYVDASSWAVDGEPRGVALETLEDLIGALTPGQAAAITAGFDQLKWGRAERLVKLREFRGRGDELIAHLRHEFALVATRGARGYQPRAVTGPKPVEQITAPAPVEPDDAPPTAAVEPVAPAAARPLIF